MLYYLSNFQAYSIESLLMPHFFSNFPLNVGCFQPSKFSFCGDSTYIFRYYEDSSTYIFRYYRVMEIVVIYFVNS